MEKFINQKSKKKKKNKRKEDGKECKVFLKLPTAQKSLLQPPPLSIY